ncbi:hypothetical protein ACE1B4_11270 [Aeromonas veronii]|uniref:hypothetical protein n=1 Tax=Aeromonas veronii TaxID=654 RepID=UPI001115E079|nr:hypothetical protein [Aeromonas veronii]TNI03887.1 hypothetical protein CF135_17515 [Aeromonas veronii]HDO1310918.1 hypothetical protein [Aeromonas veronii]
MKLATQERSRHDVLQYAVDDVWAVKTINFPAGLPVDLTTGDAVDPATMTKVTGTSTACVVVADPVKAGSKYVVVFDKLVNLISSQISGASAVGTTKALELLAQNQFIRLV